MKKSMIFGILFLSSMLLVSCGKSPQEKIVGEWELPGIGTMTFESDGTFINDTRGCITLTKEALDDNASQSGGKYNLHVSIDHSSLTTDTICFDAKGRPHDGKNFSLSSLISEQKVLKLSYRGKNNKIYIEPVTGYAIMEYN